MGHDGNHGKTWKVVDVVPIHHSSAVIELTHTEQNLSRSWS